MATATSKKAKSLLEMVKERTRVDIEFSDIIAETTNDGTTVLRLALNKPIDHVVGGLATDRRGGGRSVQLEAFDVAYVRIGTEGLDKINQLIDEGKSPFTWTEEGKSGTLNTAELKLDVSQRLEVWVVATSLAAFGAQNRGGGNRIDSIAKQIADFKAQKEMKALEMGGNKNPESVGEDKK